MRTAVRTAGAVVGLIVGLFLVGRAIVEPFGIDTSDPASYRDDWGGPSLLGVLAVHCGPGVVAAAVMVAVLVRRRARRGVPSGVRPAERGPW